MCISPTKNWTRLTWSSFIQKRRHGLKRKRRARVKGQRPRAFGLSKDGIMGWSYGLG
jgi:hypothetical protein